MIRLRVAEELPDVDCPVCGTALDELIVTNRGGVTHPCGHRVDATIYADKVDLRAVRLDDQG